LVASKLGRNCLVKDVVEGKIEGRIEVTGIIIIIIILIIFINCKWVDTRWQWKTRKTT
jgi:hypothetical protein